MTDPEIDLWGDPIPPRVERRGRRPHEATPEKRARIKVLRALNKTEAEIAAATGIAPRTMRRYYGQALKEGRAQARAEAMVRLWQAVERGSVAAIRLFLQECERADLAAPRPVATKLRKLGKKEQALIDAAAPDAGSAMGRLMQQRATPLGKKAQAAIDAEDAEEGTSWEGLLH